jgi:C-terminal processing protease CtpA/Prc
VFILAGPRTASAAESFTYDLQSLNRVQVVGKRTAGAAHPGGFVRVSEHFAVFIPNGRPVNPVTGTNWERTGVPPDVDVAVEEALTRAHILALEKLLAQESSVSSDREAQLKALAAMRERRE